MKSLERRFKNISEKHSSWSDYVCLAESVKNQHFTREIIQQWFKKLVDKKEYDLKDKRNLITNLEDLSNPVEDTPKRH